MFKVNNRTIYARCEICSKLTIKTPERRHWRRYVVFTVDFEHISHLVLVSLLLTLSRMATWLGNPPYHPEILEKFLRRKADLTIVVESQRLIQNHVKYPRWRFLQK